MQTSIEIQELYRYKSPANGALVWEGSLKKRPLLAILEMLSLFRARNDRRRVTVVDPSTSPSQRVTITGPAHYLNATTLHVRARPRRENTMPALTLEHNPNGFTQLDPDWMYVMRRGRGRNRRNYFVRGASGRTTPITPPPWTPSLSDEETIILCGGHPWPRFGGCGCGVGGGGGGSCCCAPPRRPPPPPPHPRGRCPYPMCGRCIRPRPFRHGPHRHLSHPSPSFHMANAQGSPPPHHSRHVHWPDNRSDGSLSPVPSLCSDSSSSSSSSSSDCSDRECGGCSRVPRTPSSSPQRAPRGYHQGPGGGCGTGHGACCGVEPIRYAGYPRDMMPGGGARWREAPCWDNRLGAGLVREPRF